MSIAKLDASPDMEFAAPPVRVLLLEDDMFDRMRLRKYFDALGIAIDLTEIAPGAELGAYLDRQSFDVVLLSYASAMAQPQDAIEAVHAHPDNGKAAVVLMSSRPNPKIAAKAAARGCQNFFSKDKITVRLLQEIAVDALQHRQSMRPAPKLEQRSLVSGRG